MAFHHRKILNKTADDPSELQICLPFCDITKTPDGHCPFACKNLCYPTCKIPFLDFPPPSPPDDDFSGYDNPPDKSYKLSLFFTISLTILVTTFLFFACYTTYRFYLNWSSGRRARPEEEEETRDDFLDEDHGPVIDHHIWYIRTIGLQPAIIGSIAVVKYKRGDGLVEGTDCSVCLSEFQEDENLRLLPKCNHAFHLPCIDTWLGSHTNCPVCRAGIMNNDTGVLASHDQLVQNLAPVEEARLEVSEDNGEIDSQLSIRIDNESESQAQIRDNGGSEHEVQPTRRSVSLDYSSASGISSATSNSFPVKSGVKETNSGTVSKMVRKNSIEMPHQTGPSSVKRSVSCSAKVFLTGIVAGVDAKEISRR